MKGKCNRRTLTGFSPRRSLGQNFLLDDALLEKLTALSGVTPEDSVLEIGAGMGTLTANLAACADQVLAIEVEGRLRPYLMARLAHLNNVHLCFEDVLRMDLAALCEEIFGSGTRLCVAANLPYYMTTDILLKLYRELPQARLLSLMLQRESAVKLTAKPGQEGYGPLTLLTQRRYEVQMLCSVPASCFVPAPKVDSSFVRLTRKNIPPYEISEERSLEQLIRKAFMARRKTLKNNLCMAYSLPKERIDALLSEAGIPLHARAEEIDLQTFCHLERALTTLLAG